MFQLNSITGITAPLSGSVLAGQVIADDGTASFQASAVTDPIRGIALSSGEDGDKIPIASIGDDVRAVVGSVAVSVGDQLTTDANGYVTPATAFAAGATILGECTRAAVAGGACYLRLSPHKTYAAGTGDTTLGVWLTNASSSTSYGLTAGALQAAIAAAGADDTILVNKGSYAGPIVVPADVEVRGEFTNSFISNATTTDTVTLSAGAALRNITVQGPTVGGTAAVIASHTSAQVQIIDVAIMGNGGSHGIVLAGTMATFSLVQGIQYRSGTLTGDILRLENGNTITLGLFFNSGIAASFVHFVGGNHSGSDYNISPSPSGDAVDAGFKISATAGILRASGIVIASIGWSVTAKAIHLTSNGAELNLKGFRLGSYLSSHFYVDPALVGSGTKVYLEGDMDHQKISYPPQWIDTAEFIGHYLDLGSEGDEAHRFISEVTVGNQANPREFIVGGDSSSKHLLAYTDISSVQTDVSAALKSASASPTTLGSGLNDCLYIGCTEPFWTGSAVDYFKFPGFKIAVNTALGATDVAANALIFEFGNDSAGWTDLQTMSVANDHDPLTFADTPLQRAASEQVHFDCRLCTDNGTDPVTGAAVLWTKNDPVSYGTDLYWMRIRNRVALSDPAPVLEQVKLYPIARTEIEGTGAVHYYGAARTHCDLPLYIGAAARPPINTPANRNLYYSQDHCMALDFNEFATGALDVRPWQSPVPLNLDTSSGVHVTVRGRASSTATGNMVFKLIVGHTKEGDPLLNANPTTSLADDVITTLILPQPAVANVETRFLLSAVTRHLLARRTKGLKDDGDNMFITLVRDGTDPLDTYSGSFAVSQVNARYFAWRA